MSTVSYHRLFNLGSYENEKIGFELPIEPGESHADALNRVKALVMELGGKSQEHRKAEERRQKAEYELYGLENKLGSIRREVAAALKKHDDLRAMLEKHGVTIEALDGWYREGVDMAPAEESIEADSDDEEEYEEEIDD